MPLDDLLTLRSAQTVTSGTDTGAAVNIASVRRGNALYARVRYRAASNASGSNTVAWKVQHSADGSTFYDHVVDVDQNITLGSTAAEGVFYLPISTDKSYVRIACVMSGSGTSPTVTYSAEIVLSKA